MSINNIEYDWANKYILEEITKITFFAGFLLNYMHIEIILSGFSHYPSNSMIVAAR